ncbi:MAG TPA: enolase C-terminal domain-like protein [Gaiellaceae bacterium]|nr:enolase C-terminal domain-like protein [Gaiellaceae bacterium]
MVVVELHAGDANGLGYTYGPRAVATLIEEQLAGVVLGSDPLAVRATWRELGARLRNAGRPGIGAMAVSAVDVALWDLKARLLGLPLVDLLDRAHDEVPVYGSGGFCNYPLERLRAQLGGWVERGIPRVKLKVSRRPEQDPERLDAVRAEIGDDVELYVDANGALARKQALAWAERFAGEWGVTWFEEPVSSADLEGLRLLRDRGPGELDVAAGEYVYVLRDAVNLLEAQAVDCLQLDVTRCGGVTGLLECAGAADAYQLDVSGHCAPQLSAHALCAVRRLRHLEYFHDHDRVERLLFDGCLDPEGGALRPDRGRPGHGLELKHEDAAEHCVARAEAAA